MEIRIILIEWNNIRHENCAHSDSLSITKTAIFSGTAKIEVFLNFEGLSSGMYALKIQSHNMSA